jgi:hypothetical protein
VTCFNLCWPQHLAQLEITPDQATYIRRVVEVQLYSFSSLATLWGVWSRPCQGLLTTGKKSLLHIHWTPVLFPGDKTPLDVCCPPNTMTSAISCSRFVFKFSAAGAVQNSPLHCIFLLQIEKEKERTQLQLSPLLYVCQKYMKPFNLYCCQLLLLLTFMFNFNFFQTVHCHVW